MISTLPIAGLLLALAAASVAGCTVGPNFRPPTPDLPAGWSASAQTSEGQSSQVAATPADASAAAWWTSFNDPELTSLVGRVTNANLDAKEAVLRIAEARAQHDVAAADRGPSLTANAGVQVNRLSDTTPTGSLFNEVGKFPGLAGVSIPNPYDQYQLGFDASWEVDLFGRVRRSVEAASADTAAQVEDSRAVLIAMLGDVGRAYIDLRGAQARRAVVLRSNDIGGPPFTPEDYADQQRTSERMVEIAEGGRLSAGAATMARWGREAAIQRRRRAFR